METKVTKQRKLLITFGLLLICTGCTYEIPINANLPSSPAVDPLPLSIGLYYSREFLDTIQEAELVYHKFRYSIGPPSAQLFDQIFGAIFEKTVHVDNLPPLSPDATKLDAIIEPRIEGLWIDQIDIETGIHYSITVFSLSGEKLASVTVGGRGKSSRLGPVSNAKESIHESLRHVAAQLMANFCEHKEVREWLQHAGINSPQED
jgi:hypothetical protein